MASFPKGFLWGAATSSHQVEGDNRANDWWAWEQVPGHIADGTTSGAAAGWWAGRAEEDLTRASGLGMNAHRMSLEWSRIEPEPGRFDADALARYAAILAHARREGLATLVTLNHFTLPRWAADRGSWAWDGLPARFEAFARRCVTSLGDVVDLWATLNEPSVLAFMGYAGRAWPPGLGSLPAAFAATARMLEAHARAFRAMHAAAPGVRVGLVLNVPLFEPARAASRRDRLAARLQDRAFTGTVLDALRTGWLLPPLAVAPRKVAGLARGLDFLGLNYYGRFAVRFDPRGDTPLGRHVQSPTVRTDRTDWGEPCPRGLTANLLRLSELGVPLYVTENGVYDNEDTRRPAYLRAHVAAVADALRLGADVRGYFHWSLVDNFEWAEGYRTHFGLLALDRATQARAPRGSAAVYEAICRSHGEAALGQ